MSLKLESVGKNKKFALFLTVLLIGFVVFTFIILNYALPPFQNPDEPMHFGAIMIDLKGEEKAAEVEMEIIGFMDKYSWWKFLGMGRPSPLPLRLTEISFLTQNYPLQDIRMRLNNLIVYHKVMAFLLRRIFGQEISQVRAYYFLRLTSAFFAVLSLIIFYYLGQKIGPVFFNEIKGYNLHDDNIWDSFYCLFPVLITAFLPQFLITSLAVSPDAFCVFLGSVFFAASYNLILNSKRFLNMLLITLVALVGFFTDRSLFFLLILIPVAFILAINLQNIRKGIIFSLASIFFLMVVLYLLVHLFPLLIENSYLLMRNALRGGIQAIKQLFLFGSFTRRFFLQLTDSFLVRFGWMCFSVDSFIYWIWKIFIIISGIGFVIFIGHLFLSIKKKLNLIKLIFFSLAAIIIQLIAIYAYYGRVGSLPQGRYLFPLIVPLIFLFNWGMLAFFSIFMKRKIFAGLAFFIILEFFLLNYVLWVRIFPVFHLVFQSPYPGI